MTVAETYVTIIGHAVGNDRDGFRVAHDWDRRTFASKAEAVTNGFETAGCDDFNIGVVTDGRLASLWWMDNQIQDQPGELEGIGREIGLEGHRG
jgi:hypothetical protein